MISRTSIGPWIAPLIAVWLALPPPVLAQEPESSFSETIEVNLVNVHVVITTFSGKPITGLTRDDFLVWEDGEPREITHFAQVLDGVPEPAFDPTSPEAALPHPPVDADAADLPGILPVTVFDRSIVMAFDAGLDRPYFKRAVNHSRDFVAEHADDGIWWSVVLLGRRPFNLVPLTSDSAQVVAALDELATDLRGVRLRPALAAILADVWWVGAEPRRPKLEGPWCRLPLTEHSLSPTYMAQSLSQLFRAYASVPGVKACVVYQAGSGGSRLITVDQVLVADRLVDLWSNLSRLASSTGFAVYAMDVTGLDHPVVATASNHGSYSTALLHSIPTTSAPDFGAGALAANTGGEFVQSNDLARALEIAAQGTATYYSLAFAAPRSHDDRPHHVEVQAKIPGHPFARVRYSTSFMDVDPRTLLVEHLATTADFPKVGGAIPLNLEVEVHRLLEEQVDLTATAKIPSGQLTFVPRGDDSIAEVDVFVAIHDSRGELVHIKQDHRSLPAIGDDHEPLEVRLPLRMLLPDAPYQITVALYDTVSGLSGMASVVLSPSATSG